MKLDKILVTSALTYANGKLHIGHIAGSYLNADVFVRYQKLLKNDVIYIGGSDDYGTPISLKAEEEGVTPQSIVDKFNKSMRADLAGLNIRLDNFSGTSHQNHIKDSQDFFTNLNEAGYIKKRSLQQFYDASKNRFLSDRLVEGICPFCKADGARGDQCDECGKLIDAMELIDPKSKLSAETPIIKETTHWYLDLPKFENELKDWLETKTYWKDNVRNFILSWLNEGLQERAITRDLDWGVPIPLENTDGKVLYVWFDAPIGYLSSTKEFFQKIDKPEKWKDYWLDKNTKMVHFLGKDNIPFHTIIWPAMLSKQKENFVLPHNVPANEYLTLEGQKMSTSRDWTVWVEDYLQDFEGEYLRFVLAANAPETRDSDFNWKDFQLKINNDLNNVLGNLANRNFMFAKKYFDGNISRKNELSPNAKNTLTEVNDLASEIGKCYANYEVRKATKLFIDIARIGNKYFNETQPWKEIKTDSAKAEETLFICSEILRIISIVASPVIPKSMDKLRKMLGLNEEFFWQNLAKNQHNFIIDEVERLYRKIDDNEIEKQINLLEKKKR
ncbi:MAG: methionine--tRNA ligase [Candidatus Cloacimonetes bacterium]|nr:methionine--tRNA ligase [Candidatus Cloacimonadota bacterium]MBT6994306.1 methionine--tRNA ligase [Candidatus Cloacimonadota bacterium]MBT7468930.1 methionine--tRNA ligase [Candidatus Cloacimonadota bacterium]